MTDDRQYLDMVLGFRVVEDNIGEGNFDRLRLSAGGCWGGGDGGGELGRQLRGVICRKLSRIISGQGGGSNLRIHIATHGERTGCECHCGTQNENYGDS